MPDSSNNYGGKNTYHLYVHIDGGNEKQSAVSTKETGIGDATPQGNDTAESALVATKGLVSFSAVRAFAGNLISYEISQVELRTGAREYEQKLRFGYEMANKGLNVVTATAAGFAMGGAFGAVAGLIGSLGYTVLGYVQNANTIRTQENLEDVSIGMANIRAGVSGRRGRTQ